MFLRELNKQQNYLKMVLVQNTVLVLATTPNILWVPLSVKKFHIIVQFGVIDDKNPSS